MTNDKGPKRATGDKTGYRRRKSSHENAEKRGQSAWRIGHRATAEEGSGKHEEERAKGVGQRACVSDKKALEPSVSQDFQDSQAHMKNTKGREAFILKDSHINDQHTAVDLM